jgi:hypothetical protein
MALNKDREASGDTLLNLGKGRVNRYRRMRSARLLTISDLNETADF